MKSIKFQNNFITKLRYFKISDFGFRISDFRNNGFTFLEIMIALSIVGIAVIAIFNTVNYHADVAYEHTITTKMLLLAKEKLAEMEMNPENKKGNIPETDFSYETTVAYINDSDLEEKQSILEVKAVIKGQGKEVELSQLVLNNQD
jgi:prepilin-type N-terminal cleavage/methylation domain-containing protein